MKKVLMVAYQFPPMGGSGVQRTTKFAKYLRNFDWEPVVLTRATGKMPLKDESMLRDIPADIRVVRTSPWDFTELPGVLRLMGKIISRKMLVPDGERLWQLFSRNTAVRTILDEGIELVYTTSYPYSDHLMGLHLKTRFPHIPWVADFRDEWTNNPYLLDNPHNRVRMGMEADMERKVLGNADLLITNTPVMLENFLKGDISLKERFHVIPNGYDEEDFAGLQRGPQDNGKFTVTYTGLLYGRRKPDVFFEAVRQLMLEDRIDENRITVRLIGNYKLNQISGLVERFGLQNVVEILPYMEHRECIRHLLQSDALLLIEGAGPGAEAFYTGKVFEYMNAGRPIMAVIPENGAAARLIRETRTGHISDCSNIAAVKDNFLKIYKAWLERKNDFKPDRELIGRYERKVLTGRLVKVFEEAVTKSNPVKKGEKVSI